MSTETDRLSTGMVGVAAAAVCARDYGASKYPVSDFTAVTEERRN